MEHISTCDGINAKQSPNSYFPFPQSGPVVIEGTCFPGDI